ncbi:MAG: HAMP domain-containing histidine kinase [Opitutaceae bacterium]|nr:HAMP domain-containing histidine kinase [Opitutaceae bacterium]
MSPVSRRILVYWLLLLVPTLAVGAGALLLLRRERDRLAESEAYATEARRAAVAARAGLIVENVELLVGDFQAGLLETLEAMPAAGLDAELQAWEKANPLVRSAFRCMLDGRIVFPPATAADEEARGFRRRLGPLLESSPPWRSPAAAPAAMTQGPGVGDAVGAAPYRNDEREARQLASANVSKIQSARREAQDFAKAKEFASRSAASEADSYEKKLADAPAAAATPLPPGRRGWTAWSADGRRHLLGWIERAAAGEVRGVEVELTALAARLGAALPVETGSGEGYALRDDRGRVLHQAGLVPRGDPAPVVRLPLNRESLPGWEVVAFLDTPAAPAGAAGSGLLAVGSLLAVILLVAILAGGSLLMWQARQSEAEAAQKTSFVANVSHEFKTPLTTIRLYAELLELGRVPAAEKRAEYLRTIGRETQRLARLVGNALEFSRLEQGRKQFERVPLDLGAELTRLLDTHEPRLAESGLRLRRDLPGAPLTVATDRDACEQIVLNLLDNAAKYAAAGGEVTVELAPRPGGGARVRVLDRGPGVPPEHRERIFEKFHRVDNTLTAGKTGAGLGLSIARQLARGLGGDLRHEPRADGGSAFILDLP